MRLRFVAASIVVVILSATGGQARPFPPEPDFCAGQFHRGPIATSCPFLYGGGRVTVFGATLATETTAGITIEIVIGQGVQEQVLFSCSSGPDMVGPIALPTSECVRRSSFLPVADGTEVRCRHRGPGEGAYGCLST